MEKKINNSKVNTKDTVTSTASNAWAGCRTYAHSEEDELLDLDKVTDSKSTINLDNVGSHVQIGTDPKFTTTGVTIPDLKERLADLEKKVSTMEVKLDILQSLFNTAATALSDEDLIEEYASEDDEEDSEDLDDVECNEDYDGDDDDDDDEEDERFWEYEQRMKEQKDQKEEESDETKPDYDADLAEGIRLFNEMKAAVMELYKAVIMANADLEERCSMSDEELDELIAELIARGEM